MSFIRYIERLKLMDSLIRKKSTGNQVSFSRKISMSRSLLNNYLNEMRELGFPIEFDKHRNTYYYTEEGQLVKNLFQKPLTENESKHIKGGAVIFPSPTILYFEG